MVLINTHNTKVPFNRGSVQMYTETQVQGACGASVCRVSCYGSRTIHWFKSPPVQHAIACLHNTENAHNRSTNNFPHTCPSDQLISQHDHSSTVIGTSHTPTAALMVNMSLLSSMIIADTNPSNYVASKCHSSCMISNYVASQCHY